jgi:hypothetical protein
MKRFDKKTQLVLWRLIVESGTPEAQKAVMDAALNPSYGRTTHIRALVNCIDFTNPQGFMVDDLLKLHRNPALNGEAESGAIYANMSLLAVGSLGYRDKLNNETIEKVAGELTDNLKNAEKNISETALTLSAIGNTGNNNLIPVVKPYLDDNDEMVRKAAAESLRRMDDPEAQKLLISRYEKDASQKVREEALKSLNETPLTKESDAWARESVLNAQTPNETVLIIEILGKTLKTYPQNDAALRKLLDKNPPIPVKQTIFKFIAPKR